jgi:hypothetical protein
VSTSHMARLANGHLKLRASGHIGRHADTFQVTWDGSISWGGGTFFSSLSPAVCSLQAANCPDASYTTYYLKTFTGDGGINQSSSEVWIAKLSFSPYDYRVVFFTTYKNPSFPYQWFTGKAWCKASPTWPRSEIAGEYAYDTYSSYPSMTVDISNVEVAEP